jgi:hypothetical protein
MNAIVIRKDGFISTNVAIPEKDRYYQTIEMVDDGGISARPVGAPIDPNVQVTYRNRFFVLVAKTPRGIRIYEEQ